LNTKKTFSLLTFDYVASQGPNLLILIWITRRRWYIFRTKKTLANLCSE